jgi:UDP-glucose 4-epimerase
MTGRKKILVTGGAGFIGSHVVDGFLAAGFEVVVVDNLSTGRRGNLNPAATFYELDIRDAGLAAVFEKERPAFVSHHAAQIEVRKSVADPLFDAEVNVLGSLNLLECAREAGVERVVYASTGGAVYGEPVYLPCDEAHPVAPLSPYGASKFVVEKYLSMYQQSYGLAYTVLRYANVYGPRQNPRGEAGVVAIFAYQMLRGGQTMVNGDGDQERDFVYVGDVVQANLAAVQSGVSGVFNIGTGLGTSINQIYDHLAEVTGYPGQKRHGPAKLGETRRIYLDVKAAEKALGWQPAVDLAEGLGRTVAYFRDIA